MANIDAAQHLIPPSIVLMGASGTGKTDSVATLIEAGLEVFFLGTEPGATEVLIDSVTRRGLDITKLHYHQMRVTAAGWSALDDNLKIVGAMNYEQLSTLKDVAKQKMTHLLDLIKALKDFPDDRTGLKFGDVTTWGFDRAIVMDSLSGLNKMAREYVVGHKPTMHQGEWGVAMQLEENIIYKIIDDRRCFFVLIAHVDRELDEVLGQTRLMMAALGRKLAPQLLKYFSEIIYTKRENEKFFWSTAETNVDVKNRALPISGRLDPSFVPIVKFYRDRVHAINMPGTSVPGINK